MNYLKKAAIVFGILTVVGLVADSVIEGIFNPDVYTLIPLCILIVLLLVMLVMYVFKVMTQQDR